MGSIPVIDIGPFRRGEDAAHVVQAVRESCETLGFLVITGHGVPEALIDRMAEVTRTFFDLPETEKRTVTHPDKSYPYGYSPLRAESLAYGLGKSAPPDLKEALSIGPVDPLKVAPADPDAGFYYQPNLWPARPDTLQEVWQAYFRALALLSEDIMRIFALALDLPVDWFADKIDSHGSCLRAINYPDQPEPPLPGQLRAGEHTDYGTLTILKMDAAPGGLEVLSDGAWIPVRAGADAFVVNIGDLMARWTNDRWVSTLHRVANPDRSLTGSTRRQSLAFFHQPNSMAEIRCIETCVAPGEQPLYPPILADHHRRGKFLKTVALPG